MGAKTRFSAGKGFAIALPFLLFFAGVFCLSMYLFQSVVEETAYFGLLVGDSAPREVSDEDTGFTPGVKPEKLEKMNKLEAGARLQAGQELWLR